MNKQTVKGFQDATGEDALKRMKVKKIKYHMNKMHLVYFKKNR